MSKGFANWAVSKGYKAPRSRPKQPAEPGAEDQETYVVDNSILTSREQGLRYYDRAAPYDVEISIINDDFAYIEESDWLKGLQRPDDFARWDARVVGTPDQAGKWLKVGDEKFLPMWKSGVQVVVPESELAREEPEAVVREDAEDERVSRAVLWEVCAPTAAIRQEPRRDARLKGTRKRSMQIEVGEWDPRREWRKVFCPSAKVEGWMMIDHSLQGALIRPLPVNGVPWNQMHHLDIFCEAVRERSYADLFLFIQDLPPRDESQAYYDELSRVDQFEMTPLMIAAKHGHWDCYVLLLSSGADPNFASMGRRALDYGLERKGNDKEFVKGLDATSEGVTFDAQAYEEVRSGLLLECKEMCDTLFDKAASERKENSARKEAEVARKEQDRRQKVMEAAALSRQNAEKEARASKKTAQAGSPVKGDERIYKVIGEESLPVYQDPDIESDLVALLPIGTFVRTTGPPIEGVWIAVNEQEEKLQGEPDQAHALRLQRLQGEEGPATGYVRLFDPEEGQLLLKRVKE